MTLHNDPLSLFTMVVVRRSNPTRAEARGRSPQQLLGLYGAYYFYGGGSDTFCSTGRSGNREGSKGDSPRLQQKHTEVYRMTALP